MTGERIGGRSPVDGGGQSTFSTSEPAAPAPARPPLADASSPAALARLAQAVQRRREEAAGAIVGGKHDGFAHAESLYSKLAHDDPNDWRTQACLALIAWSKGKEDGKALLALSDGHPERAASLERIHEMVEGTLAAHRPFEDVSLPKDAHPAIAIPGKQLQPDGTMDDDLHDRLEVALTLAKQYPDAPIVLSGGATVTKATECGVMAEWFLAKGIDPGRLLLDPLSTVTTANALQTIALLRSEPEINHLLLVTNPYHIRRTAAIFGATLLQDDARIDLTPVPAGNNGAEKLAVAAGAKERADVYLDTMRACGLFAYRGRPQFYEQGNVIGDRVPGDPQAGVEVVVPEHGTAPGAPTGTPEFVEIRKLARGELPRGSEGALVGRVLTKYGKVPSREIRIPLDTATEATQKAAIDALDALGLKHARTEKARDHLKIHIEQPPPAATTGNDTPPKKPGGASPRGPLAPIITPRTLVMEASKLGQESKGDNAGAAPRTVVVGEPRFLVSPENEVHLNGAIHAVDLDALDEDSIRNLTNASYDEVRMRIGTKNWNEEDLMKVGREGARLLREAGKLIVSTGAQPDAPIEIFIKAFSEYGFSVRVTYPVETPFYPVMSDPSAGGVTFECVKLPPLVARKRARVVDPAEPEPARTKRKTGG